VDLFVPKTKVLFVCAANICRSPLAEGVMRHRLQEMGLQGKIVAASAGVRASQARQKPDMRAQRVAAASGVSLAGIKSRQIKTKDLIHNETVLAMDRSNLRMLRELSPVVHRHKLHLLMSFAPELGLEEVPDPYYGSYGGFEEVFRLIEIGVSGLLNHMVSHGK
jgi:protein-tyrosine phosphatase